MFDTHGTGSDRSYIDKLTNNQLAFLQSGADSMFGATGDTLQVGTFFSPIGLGSKTVIDGVSDRIDFELPNTTPVGSGSTVTDYSNAIPAYEIPIVKLDSSTAVKGTPGYDLLNDPTKRDPFTLYDLGNGKSFTTNGYGYVDELTFTPENVKVPRDSRQTEAGKKGESTDVGGHAQACSQGGTCDEYNLFPQDSNFNNSAYKVWYENIVRPALADPNQTVGQTTIKFTRIDPSSYRPDRLEVTYTINNQTKTVYFRNEKNQTPEVKDDPK